MNKKDAKDLLKKHREGTLTQEEKVILESWYLQLAASKKNPLISPQDLQSDLENISRGLPNYGVKPALSSKRYVRPFLIAASIVLFVSVGILFYLNKAEQLHVYKKSAHISVKDISPGGNKAILTLGDNTQVLLDSTSSSLSYKFAGEEVLSGVDVEYNTIATPQGGEFKLELSDGTIVWLNALSSIRFPTTFTENERRVEITGEAYFEVAKNTQMPFLVVSNKQIIEVLGTHFNVNAYQDEHSVKTTLVEGSVRVYTSDRSASRILEPGQQSVILKNGNTFDIQNVDLDAAVSWKNGYFRFVDEDLRSIMAKLSRWYNVDIEYQNVNPQLKFGGVISRSRNLSQVLKLLELTGNVKFKVEERRIVVMP